MTASPSVETEGRSARLRLAARRLSSAALLLAGAIAILWFGPNRSYPVWALPLFEMKLNTCIGFLALGFAARTLDTHPRPAAAAASAAILLGALTLAQYLAGRSFGVDELLLRDWSAQAADHGGRPSPNTATLLAALGAAILLTIGGSRQERLRAIARAIAFVAVAIALSGLAGQLADSRFFLGWGSSQRIAVPTALSTICVAGSLLARLWSDERTRIADVPLWMPALLCFCALLFDIGAPVEINAGIAYIPLVFCSLWFKRSQATLIFAGIASLLILLGYLGSPPGAAAGTVGLTNRALALGGIWAVAALVYRLRESREQLRRAASHLTAAQQIAAVGSFEFEFLSGALRCSETMRRELGEARCRDWDGFRAALVQPADRAALDSALREARTGRHPSVFEFEYRTEHGQVRLARMHAEPLADETGSPCAMLGTIRDITVARAAEQRQAKVEQQLRQAQKLDALGVLASGIAHDLNNMLVPITSLAPALREAAATEAARDQAELVIRSGARAKELVAQILNFSRQESEAFEIVDLAELTGDALAMLRAGVRHDIRLVAELEPVPRIFGNKGQLYQVILNLVTNAAQSIDGPGVITLAIDAVPSADGAGAVRLLVADDGGGIAPELEARIFDAFFTTKAETGGTGLGLSMVQEIVAAHHGTIALDSAPGRGTRFEICIPVDPEVAQPDRIAVHP